jgi:hypothetical protein
MKSSANLMKSSSFSFVCFPFSAAALIPKGLAGQIYTQISDIE